jgi:hypothetical protein
MWLWDACQEKIYYGGLTLLSACYYGRINSKTGDYCAWKALFGGKNSSLRTMRLFSLFHPSLGLVLGNRGGVSFIKTIIPASTYHFTPLKITSFLMLSLKFSTTRNIPSITSSVR